MTSIIEEWGFDASDKVVILHLDDLGIAHSCNQAAEHIFTNGITRTGSIIANASWVPEIIEIIRSKQELNLDIGVHLAFNSEHTPARWRPLCHGEPQQMAQLTDTSGYMWSTLQESIANISPAVGEMEMRAQISHLQQNGIDLTHLDTHMYAVCLPKFLPYLIKIAQEFKIPAFVPIISDLILEHMGFKAEIPEYHRQLANLQEQGYPIVDDIKFTSLEPVKDKMRVYKSLLRSVKPGLTHIIFHPGIYNDELQALTPDSAVGRFQDYVVLLNQQFANFLTEYGIHVGSYRQMKEYFAQTAHKLDWKSLIPG